MEEKTMKKRSLVAALAMLMVSAIVLTSSTYAWFATGTTAKVSGIDANIENADGSISISAEKEAGYKTTLAMADFEGKGSNSFASDFAPVSYDPTAGSFMAGSIAQNKDTGAMEFAVEQNTAGRYTTFDVYVKATTDCNVKITPELTASVSYIYASIKTEENATNGNAAAEAIFCQEGRSYYPLLSTAANGIDDNTNNIMDTSDFELDGETEYAGVSSTLVKANEAANVIVALKADEPQMITVTLWAEGNDAACYGTVTDGEIDFGLKFEVTAG